jgi:hypothetical protein
MKRACSALLVIGVALWAFAGDETSETPAALRNGNFVYLTTSHGNGEGENLSPSSDDRRAVSSLESEFRNWLRYKIVKHDHEADIIMVARTARRRGSPSVTIGNDPRRQGPGGLPPITGPFPGSGSPLPKPTNNDSNGDDYLLVFDAHSLDNAPPIWQHHMKNGFGPDMALFRLFKRDVEGAKP